ncbi:MAG: sulfatase-like hydrolase/transferase [Alphaproteobacteria bacterium]|nr:sulfatase-like hydrolase/transferase [Alphaproteobacteria bacterium]
MALEQKPVKNFLFIMCSQLRADHLGLYGHPSIETPNITRLAQRGVTFTRAYTQSPLDTASHISAYTGRYVSTHGSDRDYSPIRLSERTIGDYMRASERRSALIGKSCVRADIATMGMLQLNPRTSAGIIASEAGFESYDRLDGLHPGDSQNPLNFYPIKYNEFLTNNGYNSPNPWQDFAASSKDSKASSFFYENSHLPLGVHELESETNYLVKRAIDFFRDHGEKPWFLHLSLTKPHWPYAAPSPFHNLYNEEHIIAPTRSEAEKENTHPIYQAFMQSTAAQAFTDTKKRNHVMPAYMGLVKQIDEQLGGLFRMMDKSDMFRDTMIVFTSDHGAYLGDHWLGEKELFHDPVVRVPLIVYDPRQEANGSRGIKSDNLVELIDIVPTMLEATNIKTMPIHIEGRPLTPILHGKKPEKWRTAVFSEYNFAGTEMAEKLNIEPIDAKATMMASDKWKYIHFRNYPAMMFDLVNDPHELKDLGREPGYERAVSFCRNQMLEWALHHTSDTEPEAQEASNKALEELGVYNGYWSMGDVKGNNETS